MKRSSDIRERVVKTLHEHPEGLTILEIARLTDSHRHTVTKYVYELVGAQVVLQREIGTAKVCFLKSNLDDSTIKKMKMLEEVNEKP